MFLFDTYPFFVRIRYLKGCKSIDAYWNTNRKSTPPSIIDSQLNSKITIIFIKKSGNNYFLICTKHQILLSCNLYQN